MTLKLMSWESRNALKSIDASRFINEVYDLDHEEVQTLKGDIATEIAKQEPCAIPQSSLDSVTLSQPQFGCNLIRAMKRKDEDRKETIAAQRVLIDRQGKGVTQLLKCKATIAKHVAELDECKEREQNLVRKAEENRLQLRGQRHDLANQKRETQLCRDQIAQLEENMQALRGRKGRC
jgi:chromosome segregation ATPase